MRELIKGICTKQIYTPINRILWENGQNGQSMDNIQNKFESFINDGYQVSVLVTNNVTNIPHKNLGWNLRIKTPNNVPSYTNYPEYSVTSIDI